MLKNVDQIKIKHKKFIETVCETQIIYGLDNGKGFAIVPSNNHVDDNGEDGTVICFWSNAVIAKFLAKEEWEEYKLEEIDLANFLENWCIGMSKDGVYAGTDFDMNLFGLESDPIDLAFELVNEIKKHGYKVNFRNFRNIDEYESTLNNL